MYNIGICDDGENICTSIENMLLQYAQEKNIQVDTNIFPLNYIVCINCFQHTIML